MSNQFYGQQEAKKGNSTLIPKLKGRQSMAKEVT